MALTAREKRKIRRQSSEMEQRLNAEVRRHDVLPFYPQTENQEKLWENLNRNVVTLAIGPAGVGKTLVALWWGLTELGKGNIGKIYYIRSDVGCSHQRGRGALPGTMEEKMAPLIGPVYDNLQVIVKSPGAANYLLEKKIVEPILLEDLRGRSFSECLMIFDEAQNALPENVKTVVSRVGKDAKVLVTGDVKQIDLEAFRPKNGLIDAYRRLGPIQGVGTVEFTHDDVVRNGIIADILRAYEE